MRVKTSGNFQEVSRIKQEVVPLSSNRLHSDRGNVLLLQLSLENVRRLTRALFPPPPSTMHFLWEEGFGDAVRFLQREGFMEA